MLAKWLRNPVDFEPNPGDVVLERRLESFIVADDVEGIGKHRLFERSTDKTELFLGKVCALKGEIDVRTFAERPLCARAKEYHPPRRQSSPKNNPQFGHHRGRQAR